MLRWLRRPATRRWLVLGQLVVAPVGLAVLAYLLVEELPFARLAAAAFTLAASFAAALAGYAAFGLRLGHVLAAFAVAVPARAVWRIHVSSLFYYFFLPAGIGYDLSRGAKIALQATSASAGRVAAAVVVERLAGGAGLLLLLLVALPFTRIADDRQLAWIDPSPWGWAVLLGVVLAAAAGLVAWGRRTRAYRPAQLIPAVGFSALAHLLVAAAIWLVAWRLGIAVNLAEVVVVLAGTLLFQLIPVNLVGVSFGEVAALALYVAYGLDRPEALLLVAVAYVHRLAAAVLGGIVEAVAALRHLLAWRGAGASEPPAEAAPVRAHPPHGDG